ncbi:relaxase/mobilization nuclease domain-containing protein [Staphylococcus caeli]|uniref:Protein rlx n=4 Tax=Staphylococcaceae TaxID=90964 RepID=A0A1D4S2H5_9STAP|nr:relaxase/mobilization nuclease domain-containing protein [Staphylococcus caeli]HDE4585146.1 relaxase/mobilization nuclease domain-containing protein [Staphylococcus aureus]SCT53692.1 protein rlx [Staphylococcus caeli]SCT58887.1 protein rlx [Staphylococcus caeli]HDE4585337.1 relaxase/mobilization nuclease domain-containing protein [Staphylococcus aureus]HDG9278268.1 relaxase/mobilization nuclease domain-containing protein [Staphylococcus aureus]
MATTKLGNTKSASRAINYAEERAEEKSGLNCDVDYAKSYFKQTRALYGKENGVQAHTVIQSFKPGEVTAKECNEIGLELAKKIAPDYQVAVYTHTDKEHYHNHIIINSVNLETGKKYQSNKEQRDFIKKANDQLCEERGLSVPEKTSEIRYTLAEQNLIDKDKSSWKNDIRMAVEETKDNAVDFEEFNTLLKEKGIEITRVTKNNVTYRHIEEDKKVRGNTLGDSYDKGVIENGFAIEKFRREREEEEREYDEYADTFKVNWDAVAENSEDLRKRRIARTEKTKQASNKIYFRDERTTGFERKGIAGNQVEFEKDDGGLSR